MTFCQKCGTQIQDGINACPNCGTFVNNGTNGVMGTQIYVKTKIAGRGLGISGMVLGIIGLVMGFSFLMTTIDVINSSIWEFDDDYIAAVVIYSVLSILGVSLGSAGRAKGYRNGISMSGIITGIVGIALYLISIILYAAA